MSFRQRTKGKFLCMYSMYQSIIPKGNSLIVFNVTRVLGLQIQDVDKTTTRVKTHHEKVKHTVQQIFCNRQSNISNTPNFEYPISYISPDAKITKQKN